MAGVFETTIVQLCQRNAPVLPNKLILGFIPPKRFAKAQFDNYLPNPNFPAQAEAVLKLQVFLKEKKANGFAFWRKAEQPRSLYLDGGYGVGKTHLLAATWHVFEAGQKLYLSFSELVYFIGAIGMEQAVAAFAKTKLICLDEFELDDVGNTLMVAMFFSRLIPLGVRLVATSNTLPEQLGRGRFSAEDFKREIQSIAAHFDVLEMDGPDYRHREGLSAARVWNADELQAGFLSCAGTKAKEDFAPLLQHLASLHPIRYDAMLNDLDAVFVEGLQPIQKQDDALRWVHFIDKVYDRKIRFAASGCGLQELFAGEYRFGAYAKKYSRCLSRLGELLRENGQ